MMTRTIQGLSSLFILLVFTNCYKASKSDTDSPNIVILLADDLGYGDLECYGGEARTPNLNMLADQGIRFTDFYAAAPNCSPSRAGLLTGKNPSKVGIYNYLPLGHPMHLRAEETTLAEIAKQRGYRTAHMGKWHVSSLLPDAATEQPQPSDQGFDYYFSTSNNAQPSHLNPTNFVQNGTKLGRVEGYSCQILADQANHWINQNSGEPFFLYVAFHEPHKKVASPPEMIEHYATHDAQDAEYLANVENLDSAIGRILDHLDLNNLKSNTIVLFASDNGSYRTGSNGQLLGGKSFVYEGGIRVPGLLRWPNQIPSGKVISTPVSLLDVMPTFCEILQYEHPDAQALDGQSTLALLQGQSWKRDKPLSWFFYRTSPQMAMRLEDHVVVAWQHDSVRHTHPFTAPDMAYIKDLKLDTFVGYHLARDLEQQHPLPVHQISIGDRGQSLMRQRLMDIQAIGPSWQNLPKATGTRKLKSQWRQLHPTGFSN